MKKNKIIEILIIPTIVLIIGEVSVLLFTEYTSPTKIGNQNINGDKNYVAGRDLNLTMQDDSITVDAEKIKRDIKAIDRYNWEIACLVLQGLSKNQLIYKKFDVSVYKTNLAFIEDNMPDQYGLIVNNMSIMEDSNTAIDMAGNSQWTINYESNAKAIIENLKIYNIEAGDCPANT